jgi:hypothetical protein
MGLESSLKSLGEFLGRRDLKTVTMMLESSDEDIQRMMLQDIKESPETFARTFLEPKKEDAIPWINNLLRRPEIHDEKEGRNEGTF